MPSIPKIASVLVLAACTQVAFSAPTPMPQLTDAADAYTGEGGTANGGSVINTSDPSSKGLLGNLKLVDAFSHNAGAGGKASSGVAITGPINSTVSNKELDNLSSSSGSTNVLGSAYSGKAGFASGGDVTGDESGGLIDLFAGNAGKAGNAASGGAGTNIVPVAAPLAKSSVAAPKAPISPPLPLLRIIRARMALD